MKKIISLLIIGFFILNGFNAVAHNEKDTNEDNILTKYSKIRISEPEIEEKGNFIQLKIPEQTTYLLEAGKPILPVITKTFTFPIGTDIKETSITFNQEQHHLTQKIEPSPRFIPISHSLNSEEKIKVEPDQTTYSNAEFYPKEKYQIKTGIGLDKGERVVFVTTHFFTQYNAFDNIAYTPTSINIWIDYELPDSPVFSENLYDMLIITADKFVDELQPLVEHKNSVGIRTKIETVENIIKTYDGIADWEDVKLCIDNAIQTLGIKYVLLAGGHRGQTNEWWVPDFRSHNWDPSTAYDPPYDETYSSDLYFSDVYKYSGGGMPVFCDWDSNDNGIYAEGPRLNPTGEYDEPDYYPDVYLGRLPIRYSWEVPIIVEKIIDYERNATDSWYKKAVMVGGDGFPYERYPGQVTKGLYEGEIVGNEFAKLLEKQGFESTKCYCSNHGDVLVEDSDDVYDVISEGCGFAHLTGHASPMVLGSYAPDVLPLIPFYTGFNLHQFDNEGKLPFMINEGCHNAQFDVTTQDLIEALLSEEPTDFILGRFEWMPHDSSSWFVLQEGGGAIGVIGNTGLGLGGIDEWSTKAVGGWMMLRFAHAFAVQEKEYTGSVWAQGITDYVNNWPVLTDDGDRKTIEERVLLGDPSIKLGGYHINSDESGSDTDPDETEIPVSFSAPTWEVGDSWTYHLDKIDIDLSEVENRTLDILLETGDIVFEIIEVTDDIYTAELNSENISVSVDVIFDQYMEEHEPIILPDTTFHNVSLNGMMIFDKDTLGIKDIDICLNMDIGENLNGLPIKLPNFISYIEEYISIPAELIISVSFKESYPLLQFPIETGNNWGISEGKMHVSIGGSVESIWLRILNIVNNIMPIIPDQYAQYLPMVNISEVLNDFGIETEYDIELEEMEEIEDTPLFEVLGEQNIQTETDSYVAADLSLLEGNGNIYYSDSVKNVVKINIPISRYIPIIKDIHLELIETTIE